MYLDNATWRSPLRLCMNCDITCYRNQTMTVRGLCVCVCERCPVER